MKINIPKNIKIDPAEVLKQIKERANLSDEEMKKMLSKGMVRAPVKLTTSVRSKLTTCFAGEDLSVHVC